MKKPSPASLLGTQSVAETPATVDTEVFDLRQALEVCDNDWDIVRPVIEVFIQDTPDRLEALRQAHTQGDRTAILRCAHSLKSAARMVGGPRVSRAAQRLEDLAKKQDAGPLDAAIDELAAELTRLLLAVTDDERLV